MCVDTDTESKILAVLGAIHFSFLYLLSESIRRSLWGGRDEMWWGGRDAVVRCGGVGEMRWWERCGGGRDAVGREM